MASEVTSDLKFELSDLNSPYIYCFSSNIEAREALEHRLLGPLSSELRSEVTSEATGSLRGHFQRNSHSSGRNSQLRIAPSFLLHSIVVKASDFGARGPGFESHLW